MLSRYASSLSFATGITFILLFLMQALIATGIKSIGNTVQISPPSIRIRQPDTKVKVEEQVKPPPPVETPPPTETIVASVEDNPTTGGSFTVVDPGIDIPTGTPGRPNGGVVPIAIMQPQYPRRAQQRGLEGYVIVEFTVTAIGNVANAVVIEASSSLFETSALTAVSRFKYKPQVVDGVAIDTPGIRYLFSFTLED